MKSLHLRGLSAPVLLLLFLLPALGCSGGGLLASGPAPELRLGFFDELASVFPDTDPGSGASAYRMDTPRNTDPGVVLVVETTEPDLPIEVVVEGDLAGSVAVHEMLEVVVERNAGPNGLTLPDTETPAPWAVREAPFRIYEAIRPDEDASFAGRRHHALYLQASLDAAVPAGEHALRVSVRSGATRRSVTWTLEVHDVTLSRDCASEFPSTTHIDTGQIVTRHGEAAFSEGYWETLEGYARLMRHGGQNTVRIPWTVMFDANPDPAGPRLRLAEERLDRFVQVFSDAGFCLMEGGYWADGNMLAKELTVGGDLRAMTPEAERFIRETFSQLDAYLRDRDLKDIWVQHVADEPGDNTAAEWSWAAKVMREVMPDVRVLDAIRSQRIDPDTVDIYIPDIIEYSTHRDFYRDLQARGLEVWIYTLLIPGGKWVNRFIDMEHLRSVYLSWSIAGFDLDGFLHWGLNVWGDESVDPYAQSVLVTAYAGGLALPPGDAWIVYPGEGRQVLSSTRWEASRVGMEDYELLRLLEARDPARMRALVAAVFTDYQTYELDIARYRAVRADLMRAASAPPSS